MTQDALESRTFDATDDPIAAAARIGNFAVLKKKQLPPETVKHISGTARTDGAAAGEWG